MNNNLKTNEHPASHKSMSFFFRNFFYFSRKTKYYLWWPFPTLSRQGKFVKKIFFGAIFRRIAGGVKSRLWQSSRTLPPYKSRKRQQFDSIRVMWRQNSCKAVITIINNHSNNNNNGIFFFLPSPKAFAVLTWYTTATCSGAFRRLWPIGPFASFYCWLQTNDIRFWIRNPNEICQNVRRPTAWMLPFMSRRLLPLLGLFSCNQTILEK